MSRNEIVSITKTWKLPLETYIRENIFFSVSTASAECWHFQSEVNYSQKYDSFSPIVESVSFFYLSHLLFLPLFPNSSPFPSFLPSPPPVIPSFSFFIHLPFSRPSFHPSFQSFSPFFFTFLFSCFNFPFVRSFCPYLSFLPPLLQSVLSPFSFVSTLSLPPFSNLSFNFFSPFFHFPLHSSLR